MAITELGAKGRLVIPAQARAEANLKIGQPVVVRADGEGRIMIESLEAVQARVWAAAPSLATSDASGDIRELREDDIRRADEAASLRTQPSFDDTGEPDEAGAALLAALGL
jgi:AbrB family looped-hinge helix DNA binding protein